MEFDPERLQLPGFDIVLRTKEYFTVLIPKSDIASWAVHARKDIERLKITEFDGVYEGKAVRPSAGKDIPATIKLKYITGGEARDRLLMAWNPREIIVTEMVPEKVYKPAPRSVVPEKVTEVAR